MTADDWAEIVSAKQRQYVSANSAAKPQTTRRAKRPLDANDQSRSDPSRKNFGLAFVQQQAGAVPAAHGIIQLGRQMLERAIPARVNCRTPIHSAKEHRESAPVGWRLQ